MKRLLVFTGLIILMLNGSVWSQNLNQSIVQNDVRINETETIEKIKSDYSQKRARERFSKSLEELVKNAAEQYRAAGMDADKQRFETRLDRIISRFSRKVGDPPSATESYRVLELKMKSIIQDMIEHNIERHNHFIESQASRRDKSIPQITAVNEQDSLALVALYNSTNGANWTNNTNWLTGPVDTWYGITLVGDRVNIINLQDNNLYGTLPSEIGHLDALEYFSVWENRLSGAIPDELWNCTNLTHLDLDDNQFTGQISSHIGNLVNLETCWIGRNDGVLSLTGSLPSSIGNCVNLQTLGIRHTNISGSIPAELGNLSNLTTLYMHDNQLSGSIPPEMGNLSNLGKLYLYDNQLSGSIPPELGNLQNLNILSLSDNQLSDSIPPELGNLSNLVKLYLYDNQLSGSIPPELGNLQNLDILPLYNNQLSGSIPPELGNIPGISWLQLQNNQLSGPIPAELGNLSLLYLLNLGKNNLSGNIPPELGDLTGLHYLRLYENDLTGAVPDEMNNLNQLSELIISSNQLDQLPNFQALSGTLYSLATGNNNFTFEDIEPNIGITGFTYSPQDSLETSGPTEVNRGGSFTLSVTVGGTANQYQWFKNGTAIPGATTPDYTVTAAEHYHDGYYHCAITNTIATALTLYSKKKKVAVLQDIICAPHKGYDFGAVCIGDTNITTVEVQNIGQSNLILTNIQLSGENSNMFSIISGGAPGSLGGFAGYRAIVIGFHPDSPAAMNAILQIESNDPDQPLVERALTGTGVIDDTGRPYLSNCYPPPGSQDIATNTSIQMKVLDAPVKNGTGIDPATLDIYCAGIKIIARGTDQTGGAAILRQTSNGYSITYQPDEGFPEDSEITVTVEAGDLAGNTADSSYSFRVGALVSHQVRAETVDSSGGTITCDSTNIEIQVPPGAVDDTVEIGIDTLETTPELPDSLDGIGLSYHFLPDGLEFNEPVTIGIPWNDEMLSSAGVSDPLDLKINYYHTTTGEWVELHVIEADTAKVYVEVETFCYLVITRPSEKISIPGTPVGPEQAWIDTVYSYSTSGAESNYGYDVEYMFEWGDGSYSPWSEDTTALHSWSTGGIYLIYVHARSQNDTTSRNCSDSLAITVAAYTTVSEEKTNRPGTFQLNQNYPNPFNPSTNITYDIPKTMYVKLEIFNTLGQRIRTLINQQIGAGVHSAVWDARDDHGTLVSGGIYFYVLRSNEYVARKKLVYIK